MKQALHTLTVPTRGPGLYEFTDEATAFARDAKIENGLLTCFVRHTSASLLIQENADPDVQKDLQDFDYTVHAVGFGVRYKTPVGPVRGDLAYSINPPAFNGFNGTPQQLLQCNPNVPNPSLPYCIPSRQSVGHIQFFFSIGQTF